MTHSTSSQPLTRFPQTRQRLSAEKGHCGEDAENVRTLHCGRLDWPPPDLDPPNPPSPYPALSAPMQGWAHIPFGVLEAVKSAIEVEAASDWISKPFLNTARLVNHHWHAWATGAASALRLAPWKVHRDRAEHGMQDLVAKFTGLRCLVLRGRPPPPALGATFRCCACCAG
ncbi:unnamed protein product [Ostreobium quekettii]|uniref:Uncharacterized protein n=1 Tax=Ostreobium quekettii TaxID=121088 RepID=A0A8S1J0P2_9CHLO|nr:unnamed protein product [Ostreobium quekettii]|eukprot:evm.model.scf_350.1 EVM.evm.TU.scf_350.1   scf_350:17261-17773(+)